MITQNTTSSLRQRCFSFTWNNPGEEASSYLKNLGKSRGVSQLIYQLETGEKRHTPHLQGFLYFKNPRFLSAVIKLLKGAHVEKAKNIFALKQYCKKVKSRLQPYVHFLNGKNVKNITEIISLQEGKYILNKENLYPWQSQVLEIFLSEPDNRSVYYFFEEVGNTGKSSFISYLYHHYEDYVFSTSGRPEDVKFGFSKKIQKVGRYSIRAVIWDIPRLLKSKENNQVKDSVFLTAEQFKNGHFFTTKYESEQVLFGVPHVFIFSNIIPSKSTISSALSRDRWKIFQIRNKQLFPLPL